MSKCINLTGQRFNRLTAIRRVENDRYGKTRWLCRCDCGNEITINYGDLVSGNTKSCGCLKLERAVETNTTHNLYGTRLYKVWAGIKRRCYNIHEEKFSIYGGRGITMCDEWKNDFMAFHDWAYKNGYDENAPKGECTIDRIDNNGNYEPSNCRWITNKEQANNRRSSRFITYNGETHTIAEWSRLVGIKAVVIWKRLKRGWNVESTLTIPLKR